jgi:hypothetical protein
MPARREEIGERAGDDEAMSVLFEATVAHPGEAKHPLDDADRMLARTFDLVRFFACSTSSTTPRWR